jgi:hypothetical protein
MRDAGTQGCLENCFGWLYVNVLLIGQAGDVCHAVIPSDKNYALSQA